MNFLGKQAKPFVSVIFSPRNFPGGGDLLLVRKFLFPVYCIFPCQFRGGPNKLNFQTTHDLV